MNNPDSSQPVAQEKLLVWLLCALAAMHVFVFSAAFPFFSNVDEDFHFDMVVRYSNGDIPRRLAPFSDTTVPYLVYYGTLEYAPERLAPNGHYPDPPWLQPPAQAHLFLSIAEQEARHVRNHESTQPPFYYALTSLWWRAGQAVHLSDGLLLYGLRFLNVGIVVAMIWLGYLSARTLFPDRPFVRLGVASLLAFLPQSAFYTIENDALSPVCFGVVFLLLLRWLRDDALSFRAAAALGLALAATYLTKLTNVPLLAVAGMAIAYQAWHLSKDGRLRSALPALGLLVCCAALPVACWMIWMKSNFGDFTGESAHVLSQGWTRKPFSEWWNHPIFTPSGFWIYLSSLLGSFWGGELVWHGQPLVSPVLNICYTLVSLGLVALAVSGLLSRIAELSRFQRLGLWLCLACFLAGILFLGFISLPYDYQNCVQPSRAHPYFSSGRLILGAAVPFFLLFVYGLDRAMGRIKIQRARPLAVIAIILFMLVTETVTNWPVFSSQYNWFHM